MIDASYVAVGALTGFVVGLTGVGGGALMTPLLLLLFGVAPATAIATDLWFAAITKLVGARVHNRSGQVDWQVVRRLWAGSLPVALIVVAFVIQGHRISKLSWLTTGIGITVLITALGLLLAPWLLKIAKTRRIQNPAKFKQMQPGLTVLGGAVLGLCVALTSIGAGALGSVMLLYIYPLRMTPHRLVATDLVHAIPLAVTAGLGYLYAGLVDWHMLMSLLAGSLPGIFVGSNLSQRIPSRGIQILLAVVLMFTSLKTLL